MGLFKIDCHEGKMLCDKNQYKETSFLDKVMLNFYLILCSECRSYTANNVKLSKALKNKKVQSVSSQEKEVLKEKLKKALDH